MTPQSPEAKAREDIDRLLTGAGWHVADPKDVDLAAHRGVAIREFTLKPGHGEADYLLYLDGKAAGIIEAKKKGTTLTGAETRFTNGLDPDPPLPGRFRLPPAGDSARLARRWPLPSRSAFRREPRRDRG